MHTQSQRKVEFFQWFSCAHEPLPLIDATPDDQYPLRILRAHRESCDYRWGSGEGWADSEKQRFNEMNQKSDERSTILDRAIAILEQEMD